MNLNAYDSVTPCFSKTWIVPDNKKLYSYEIPYHPFYTLLKRYNNKTFSNDYFIALSDRLTDDKQWSTTYKTNSNAIKIDLAPIWKESSLNKLYRSTEISTRIDNVFEDGIVIYIDI